MLELKISIIACVICAILMDENKPLHWYYKFLERLPLWLAFPLGKCIVCFAGQIALWIYVFHCKSFSFDVLIEGIRFVSYTIAFTYAQSKFIYGRE